MSNMETSDVEVIQLHIILLPSSSAIYKLDIFVCMSVCIFERHSDTNQCNLAYKVSWFLAIVFNSIKFSLILQTFSLFYCSLFIQAIVNFQYFVTCNCFKSFMLLQPIYYVLHLFYKYMQNIRIDIDNFTMVQTHIYLLKDCIEYIYVVSS